MQPLLHHRGTREVWMTLLFNGVMKRSRSQLRRHKVIMLVCSASIKCNNESLMRLKL